MDRFPYCLGKAKTAQAAASSCPSPTDERCVPLVTLLHNHLATKTEVLHDPECFAKRAVLCFALVAPAANVSMQHFSSSMGAVPLLAAPQGELQASGHQDETSPIFAVLFKCCGLHLNWLVSSNAAHKHSKFE